MNFRLVVYDSNNTVVDVMETALTDYGHAIPAKVRSRISKAVQTRGRIEIDSLPAQPRKQQIGSTFRFFEIYNYDGRLEAVREDMIESVRKPSGRVHDNGAVVLVGGRSIAFGSLNGADDLLRRLGKMDSQ